MTELCNTPRGGKDENVTSSFVLVGIISIPFAWLLWYFGPEIELLRPVLGGIDDPALRAVYQEAHAERLGIWVGIWPVTLLVLSHIVEKKVQG